MGFRFRRSVKIAPGVRLNISKSGFSTTLGGRGATVNLSNRGIRHTVGIPGSGLSFSNFTANRHQPSSSGGNNQSATTKGCGCLLLILLLFAMLVQCGSNVENSGEGNAQTESFDKLYSPTADEDALISQAPSGASLEFNDGEQLYVSANSLNGRSAPSDNGAVTTRILRGESLQVIERSGEWAKVASDAGTVWVASRYLSRTRPAPRYTPPPRPRSYGGSCPCNGSNVCIGPRGGRYCITSGGNKRYGV